MGREFSREEQEIDEIQLVELNKIPSELAFEHSRMLEDYLKRIEGKQRRSTASIYESFSPLS
jgi:hypothetical protein